MCVCVVDLQSGTITTDSNNTQAVQIFHYIVCIIVLLDLFRTPATRANFVAVYHMAHELIAGRYRVRSCSCAAALHQH